MKMGRHYWDRKTTAEQCTSVSIGWLKKHGYFRGARSGGITWTNRWSGRVSSIGVSVGTLGDAPYVRFQYTNTCRSTGEETEIDYKVPLVTTACYFGGVRWWFICPLTANGVPCGRRVGKLYCPRDSMYYACRHCHDLSYDSRNEPRTGKVALLGKALDISRQMQELRPQVKRFFYAGMPTRKLRRLAALGGEMDGYCRIAQVEAYADGDDPTSR